MTLYNVTLERRRHGSACGTTLDRIEADTAAEAEQLAVRNWSVLPASAGFTFAPLLTVEAQTHNVILVFDEARPRRTA